MKNLKKYFYAVLLILLILVSLSVFVACEDIKGDTDVPITDNNPPIDNPANGDSDNNINDGTNNNPSGGDTKPIIEPATITGVDGGKIESGKVLMIVGKDTESVSLSDKIKCSDNSVWKLYYDKMGQTEIPTKIAANPSGTLNNGNNVFYIVVNSLDNTKTNVYELNVHRSYSVTVSYYDDTTFLKKEQVFTGEYTIEYFLPSVIAKEFAGWKDKNGKSVGNTLTILEAERFVAEWNIDERMADFKFVSDKDTCTITGVKDVNIGKVVIPDCVNSIGNSAFSNCYGLTSIEIPSSVTSIGEFAFFYCRSLTSIEIPSSVTSIGDYAFRDCSSLTSIEIPSSVTSIGYMAFSYCSGLTSITVASGNTKYHSAGNCLIESVSKTLILGCKNSVIPSDGSVTSIGSSAFRDCSSLTSIEIPSSVTSIGGSAFEGCYGLTSIEIPIGVTSIGYGAFEGCYGLTCVIFENVYDWKVSKSFNMENVSSVNVTDPKINAEYLTYTYCYYYWKRF